MIKRAAIQGFTLVELMVALGLTSFLMLGAFQVFDANFRSYNLLISDSQIQDSGRIARAIMVRDIQKADNVGCQVKYQTYEGAEMFEIGTHPAFDMLAFDGVQMNNNVEASQSIASLVDLHVTGDSTIVETGTDVLTLSRATGLAEQVLLHSENQLTVTGTEFLRGDYLMLKSCTGGIKSEVFEVTEAINANGNQTLTLNANITGVYAKNNQGLMSTSIYRIEAISYFVAEGLVSEQTKRKYSLFRKVNNQRAQEFIAGVDDLQIAFDEERLDGFAYTTSPTATVIDGKLIHVTLVVRADQTNTSDPYTGPEFGKTQGKAYPDDGMLRREVNFSARVRS